MKLSQSQTSTATAFILALTFIACGRDQVTNPANPSPALQDLPQPLAAYANDWRQISTFAQSIEMVSLAYDSRTGAARLEFRYINVDRMGSDGIPVRIYVGDLTGFIGSDGAGDLSDEQLPGYIARVRCGEGSQCGNAEIELTNRNGSLAGTVAIKQTVASNISGIYGSDAEKVSRNPHTDQAIFVRDLSDTAPRRYDLKFQEVIGRSKSFFEIKVTYFNTTHRRGETGYFDSKESIVWGETGQHSRVNLLRQTILGHHSEGVSTPYFADVNFDPAREFLNVTFRENVSTRETEADLVFSVGRGLTQPGS